MTGARETVMMQAYEHSAETDVYLLPYWFGGRVSDATHKEALLIRGNEDEAIRSMLAAEVVRRQLPVTSREWEAMLYDEELLPEEQAYVDSGLVVSRSDVDAWVRRTWEFVAAPAADDEFEGILLARAQSEPPTLCIAATERVSQDGARDRIYVGVLHKTEADYQGSLWLGVYLDVLDHCDKRNLRLDATPIFETIEVGWDWPVYYRDMVANSQLIWSASGEDIDLGALAAEQPRDDD